MKLSSLCHLFVMLDELYPKVSLSEIKGIESFKDSRDKSVYITLITDEGGWPINKKYTLGDNEWFVGQVSVQRMLDQIRINREFIRAGDEK